METVELVQGVAVIALAVSAAVLCIALTIALVALFPRLPRTAAHLEPVPTLPATASMPVRPFRTVPT